jgi:hypothetical protein
LPRIMMAWACAAALPAGIAGRTTTARRGSSARRMVPTCRGSARTRVGPACQEATLASATGTAVPTPAATTSCAFRFRLRARIDPALPAVGCMGARPTTREGTRRCLPARARTRCQSPPHPSAAAAAPSVSTPPFQLVHYSIWWRRCASSRPCHVTQVSTGGNDDSK